MQVWISPGSGCPTCPDKFLLDRDKTVMYWIMCGFLEWRWVQIFIVFWNNYFTRFNEENYWENKLFFNISFQKLVNNLVCFIPCNNNNHYTPSYLAHCNSFLCIEYGANLFLTKYNLFRWLLCWLVVMSKIYDFSTKEHSEKDPGSYKKKYSLGIYIKCLVRCILKS